MAVFFAPGWADYHQRAYYHTYDVTARVKPGANALQVKVTNLWVNRLIGDQQPNAAVKYTFADVEPYKANSPLLPSGLLGPVRISSINRQ